MSIPLDTLATAGAAVFGSLASYAGIRMTTRSSSKTEDRKLDHSEFELFKESYMETMQDFRTRYEEQEEKMEKVEHLLRLALQHIRELRTDIRQHDINPSHRIPPELERLLWTLADESPVNRQGE